MTRIFDFSRRRYRALVYLLVSVILNILPWRGIYGYIFIFVNFVGISLVLLFFGRPQMYGTLAHAPTITNVLLAYTLAILGLFVEVFAVCELAIYIKEKIRSEN